MNETEEGDPDIVRVVDGPTVQQLLAALADHTNAAKAEIEFEAGLAQGHERAVVRLVVIGLIRKNRNPVIGGDGDDHWSVMGYPAGCARIVSVDYHADTRIGTLILSKGMRLLMSDGELRIR